jgi:bacterioferritin-associated ferredoxin
MRRWADELARHGARRQFVVCNSDNPEAPSPPAGIARTLGVCADCGRGITWIGPQSVKTMGLPHICGQCARDRSRRR